MADYTKEFNVKNGLAVNGTVVVDSAGVVQSSAIPSAINSHLTNTSNPHAVTAAQAGASSSTHVHGNITNDGKVGSTADLMLKTTTAGAVTTLVAGTTSQYLRGDGTWNTPTGGQFLGTAATKAIAYNSLVIAENITIPAGVGAYSVGEIEIAIGYEVTITPGVDWVIL